MTIEEINEHLEAEKRLNENIEKVGAKIRDEPADERGESSDEDVQMMDIDEEEDVSKQKPSEIPSVQVHSQKSSNKASRVQRCQICGQNISVDEMEEHIRIELLDPKWREQRRAAESKLRDSTLAEPMEMSRNLNEFVRVRKRPFAAPQKREERIAWGDSVAEISAKAIQESQLTLAGSFRDAAATPAERAQTAGNVARSQNNCDSRFPPPTANNAPLQFPEANDDSRPNLAISRANDPQRFIFSRPVPFAPAGMQRMPFAPQQRFPSPIQQMPLSRGFPALAPMGMPFGHQPQPKEIAQGRQLPPNPPSSAPLNRRGVPATPGAVQPVLQRGFVSRGEMTGLAVGMGKMSEAEYLRKHDENITAAVSVPLDPSKAEWLFRGQAISVPAKITFTVEKLKEILSGKLGGLPAKKMKLKLSGGAFLKDSYSLAFYNISSKTPLEVGVKARGGRK